MAQSESTSTGAGAPVKLAFSEKYDPAHAEHYLHKHRATLGSRLSNWREISIARKALKLAGDPLSVLDLPCGAGRFWPMLAEKPDRSILGADNSADMVNIATKAQPPEVVKRVKAFQTSAFAIELPDGAVDCVFCMRLMHHIGEKSHRLAMLTEFHRVARESLVVSVWVDGNLKSWRRRRLEARRISKGKPKQVQNRFIFSRSEIEAEFKESGFDIVGRVDFMPLYSMWRTYVLRKRA